MRTRQPFKMVMLHLQHPSLQNFEAVQEAQPHQHHRPPFSVYQTTYNRLAVIET